MEGRERLVAVAVDRDKSSQRALKWATENFITRGQTVKLVHVLQRQPSSIPNPADHPDFCNVYVISKGKVSAARTATRPVPNIRADGFRSLQNNEAPSVIENDMYDEMGALDDHNDVSWASTGSWASDSSFVSFYESLLNPHNMDPNARRSTSTNPNSSTKPWDIDAATIPSSFECLVSSLFLS
ncbi:UspA [Corchorus olitorius]|uniref:RING-type E3 ubiquitin transferase n=1 Tax=Corchorus olitorius TaxID=93759 RepID=A0A1R3IGX7_9ROSI|nr:UspA [Corchorus olitorius]